MHRFTLRSLLVAALLIGALPGTASAAAVAVEATIDVHSDFSNPAGTFTADSPVLCEEGTTSDQTRITGSDRVLNFKNIKTFTCADGSGTFTLRINAQVMPCDNTDRGAWSVIGGTGVYEGLRGAGTLVGTYFPNDACDAEGIDDHLTGRLVLP
jgi:hypothetical protein